jgi:hypothetical protein
VGQNQANTLGTCIGEGLPCPKPSRLKIVQTRVNVLACWEGKEELTQESELDENEKDIHAERQGERAGLRWSRMKSKSM